MRVKKQIIVSDTVNDSQISIDTTYEYDFIAYFSYAAKIITDSKNVIQSAEYTVNYVASAVSSKPEDLSGISITENPVTDDGTKVLYTLKNEGPVQIEVMDELGRSVRMLLNERLSSGQHSISISAKDLPNGSYFVRLISPDVTAMKKLIIAR